MAQRILVVDDEKDTCAIIRGFLVSEDYEVEVAYGGAEGLEKIESYKPDLILLDIMMPQVDGVQVLKKLKADPVTAAIPVIFLTAVTEKKYVRAALLGGVDQYITKPFDEIDLVGKVRQTLEASA